MAAVPERHLKERVRGLLKEVRSKNDVSVVCISLLRAARHETGPVPASGRGAAASGREGEEARRSRMTGLPACR